MKIKRYLGFTLLEVLVVVSIIGVVIGLASVSYSTSQKKARDTKRQSDLKAIQSAFEQYYSSCDYVYPASFPAVGTSLSDCDSNVLIQSMPGDPKTGAAYTCSSCSATGYTITASGAELITAPSVRNLQ